VMFRPCCNTSPTRLVPLSIPANRIFSLLSTEMVGRLERYTVLADRPFQCLADLKTENLICWNRQGHEPRRQRSPHIYSIQAPTAEPFATDDHLIAALDASLAKRVGVYRNGHL